MTVEEIFKKISLHMIEGTMIHEGISNYFAFLRLNRYELMHFKRYIEESESLSKLHSYYIRNYCKLIPKHVIKNIPQVIPDNLYNHTTEELELNDIRKSVKEIFKYWLDWEESTKKLYEECYIDLIDNNSDVGSSMVVKNLLSDVIEELELVKDMWYRLKNCNFDIVYIMEDQEGNGK